MKNAQESGANGYMPAMPVAHEKYWELEASGLTKRELFAAMAMQGMLASDLETVDHRAAVRHADALLVALGGGE